ncbi:MAG: OmpA family protein [Methylococcaceae bacterium]|nr:OmpA family protein [Methylococcaceae bacterium]
MNQDDPFGNYLDEDKTVIKPSPGRRNNTQFTPPVAQQTVSEVSDSAVGDQQLNLHSDDNVLVGKALPLLALVNQLRALATHADPSGLRNAVITEIKAFDTKARQAGCPADQVQTARYALCSLLDEVVLNTPWGCNSIWSTQGMLITFHKESWGGEKFFQVLNNIISQPGTYLNLLELFYYCLSMGFEGKYKIQEQGQNKLYDVRENLYQVIQRHKGDYEPDLSISWRGITDKRNALSRFIPLWVVAAVVAALLSLIFIGFLYAISQNSGAGIGQQYQIRDALNIKPVDVKQPLPSSTPEVSVISTVEKVRLFLAKEIADKKVAVVEKGGQSIIRILAKNFFASGSDKIQSRYLTLMTKISQALEIVDSQITVVGHTDNIPIFTVKFPSNWVLSQARAQAVANILLSNEKHQNRVVAEGRADTQSLVPNDSAQHRAMNRRVEINF